MKLAANIHTDRLFAMIGPAGKQEKIGMGFTCGCNLKDKPQMTFDSFMLTCVISGAGHIKMRGKTFPLKPGMLLQRFTDEPFTIIRKEDPHWLDFFIWLPPSLSAFWERMNFIDTDNVILPIDIDRDFLHNLKLTIPRLKSNTLIEQTEIVNLAQELILKFYKRARRPKDMSANDDWLAKAAGFLEEDVQNRLLLPELAQSLNVGYEKFRKTFRKRYGVAPKEFRIRKRIEEAQKLLLERNLEPAVVAEHLGYPDVFTFSKQFKSVVGQSPATFKRGGI
jgi:AraC-like DNA-binding protein